MQPHQVYGNAEVSSKPWPLPPGQAQPASSESAAPSAVLVSGADEIAQAVLGLLAEMEASLQGSQKAVLASNGLSLENCTREQVRLHRALEMLLWPRAWPGTAVENPGLARQTDVQTDLQNDVRKSAHQDILRGGTSVPRCAPLLAAELLAAERRVLQGTRVQAALLRRARQFQRILTNVAAAQGAPYGAWFGSSTQF